MATHGEIRWPSVGSFDGRLRGDSHGRRQASRYEVERKREEPIEVELRCRLAACFQTRSAASDRAVVASCGSSRSRGSPGMSLGAKLRKEDFGENVCSSSLVANAAGVPADLFPASR